MRLPALRLVALVLLLLAACAPGDGPAPPDIPDADELDAATAAQEDAALGVWLLEVDIGFCRPGETELVRLDLRRQSDGGVAVLTGPIYAVSRVVVVPQLATLQLDDADQRWEVELRDGRPGLEAAAKVVWSSQDGNCSTSVDAVVVERIRP